MNTQKYEMKYKISYPTHFHFHCPEITVVNSFLCIPPEFSIHILVHYYEIILKYEFKECNTLKEQSSSNVYLQNKVLKIKHASKRNQSFISNHLVLCSVKSIGNKSVNWNQIHRK